MRSPRDIADAIRRKSMPQAEPELDEEELFLDETVFPEEELVEAPPEPTDYKKRIGDLLRSTRAVKKDR